MTCVTTDASSTRLSFVEETTFGQTPSTPTMQRMRFTSEDLDYAIENTTSNEITTVAGVSDLIQTGASVTGTVSFELSYGSDTDILLEHALRSDFASSVLSAGNDCKSMTWEKDFETGSPNEFLRLYGCRAGDLSLTVQAGGIITGSFGVLGLGAVPANAGVSGGSYNSANSNQVMTAIDVANISMGSFGADIYYTDLSINLTNNLRVKNAIGSLPAIDIGYGRREITINTTVYFSTETSAMLDAYIAGSEFALSYRLTDGTNNYDIAFPRCKFIGGVTPKAPGNDADVMIEGQIQALIDSSTGTDMTITKS